MAKMDEARRILDQAFRTLLSKNYLTSVGKQAADMIRLRTQLGYGVPSDGKSREKLKPLSAAYKKVRKENPLNGNTSPSKSNLTRTGQLLSSIGVKSIQKDKVIIGPKGPRNDGETNERVGEFVSEKGRPFNNLSDVERKRLTETIRKDLQQLLEKALVKLR